MGEKRGASRSPITSATIDVVAQISMIAAAAVHVIVDVVVIVKVIAIVAPTRSWVDWLHRDLGSGLSCGVESLSPRVILCPELHGGLHGYLGLLGKAVAIVGGRRAAVAWGRRVVRGRRGVI